MNGWKLAVGAVIGYLIKQVWELARLAVILAFSVMVLRIMGVL